MRSKTMDEVEVINEIKASYFLEDTGLEVY